MITPRSFFPVYLCFAPGCGSGRDKLFANRISAFEMRSNGHRGQASGCSTVAYLRRRSQASQILRVKCTQSGCNSGSNADDSCFHAWAKQRDPKLAANKQSGLPNGRRAPGMSLAIQLHLFHRHQRIVHSVASTRIVAVVFLHSRLERMIMWNWMWLFFVTGTGDAVATRSAVRFSPISKSAARLIVVRLAFGV